MELDAVKFAEVYNPQVIIINLIFGKSIPIPKALVATMTLVLLFIHFA